MIRPKCECAFIVYESNSCTRWIVFELCNDRNRTYALYRFTFSYREAPSGPCMEEQRPVRRAGPGTRLPVAVRAAEQLRRQWQ